MRIIVEPKDMELINDGEETRLIIKEYHNPITIQINLGVYGFHQLKEELLVGSKQ